MMRSLFGAVALAVLLSGCHGPQYESLDTDAWAERLGETDDAFLLDVRTMEEYEEAHIGNATLIPHDELEDRLDEMPTDRNAPVFVYCRTGNRSAQAADVLVEAGYTNIIHLDGGIRDWIEAGYPVEAGAPSADGSR